jgi:hypothetical protein
MGEARPPGCLAAGGFVACGAVYVVLYFLALVVTAVASLGGGAKSLELLLMVGFGAGGLGLVVGGATLVVARRLERGLALAPLLWGWGAWIATAVASPVVVDAVWSPTAGSGWLLYLPMVSVALASTFTALLVPRALRARTPT